MIYHFKTPPRDIVVCALLYSNFTKLHERLLNSFRLGLPTEMRIFLWCNQVGPQTKKLVENLKKSHHNVHVIYHEGNMPKYHVMRQLRQQMVCEAYKWFMWFDDDSSITSPEFYPQLDVYLETHKAENVCYIGQRWYIHHRGNQEEFIRQSAWYKGRPLQLEPNKHKQMMPAAVFATGGWWMLRMDVMLQLDWPDPRLSHNGGDTLLGVAVHQQGLPLHNYSKHVAINKAPRRGISEKRAGE